MAPISRSSCSTGVPGRRHDPPIEHASDERIAHLGDQIELVQGDLLDQASLVEALRTSRPDEVYNLAAQSFVPTSWNQPV